MLPDSQPSWAGTLAFGLQNLGICTPKWSPQPNPHTVARGLRGSCSSGEPRHPSSGSFQFSCATFFPSGLLWLGWPSCSPAVWMPHPLSATSWDSFSDRFPGEPSTQASSVQKPCQSSQPAIYICISKARFTSELFLSGQAGGLHTYLGEAFWTTTGIGNHIPLGLIPVARAFFFCLCFLQRPHDLIVALCSYFFSR